MLFRRLLCIWITISFVSTLILPPQRLFAQTALDLPAPGSMVSVSPSFEPALIRGLTVHQDNPFLFDFIVDPGQSKLSKQELKDESERMIKYFFAALTIPDKDIWVNLSPYEKDRMIPISLGQTAMGRDLLAQDYMLKQLTASLIYPQKALGKTFWNEVYTKAKAMYGTTEVPVNTFNKVWIVPQRAGIYEHGQTAFIVDGHLKVMLEEDYLAMTKHQQNLSSPNKFQTMSSPNALIGDPNSANTTHSIASNIIRQIILPEIEKEINEGKNFATLRQIFYAQVLAVWFKRNLKQALLNHVYANKGTVKGIDQNDAATNEAIFHQYLKAYKKGVFNYIQEEIDPLTQQTMPRKYFSGGYSTRDVKLDPKQPTVAEETATDYVKVTTLAASPAQAVQLQNQSAPSNAAMFNSEGKETFPDIRDLLERGVQFIGSDNRGKNEFFELPAQRPFVSTSQSGPYYTDINRFIDARRAHLSTLLYLHQQIAPQVPYVQWQTKVKRSPSAAREIYLYQSLEDLAGMYAFQFIDQGPWYAVGFYGDHEATEKIAVINLSTMTEVTNFENPHSVYTTRARIRVNGKNGTVEMFGAENDPDKTKDSIQGKNTVELLDAKKIVADLRLLITDNEGNVHFQKTPKDVTTFNALQVEHGVSRIDKGPDGIVFPRALVLDVLNAMYKAGSDIPGIYGMSQFPGQAEPSFDVLPLINQQSQEIHDLSNDGMRVLKAVMREYFAPEAVSTYGPPEGFTGRTLYLGITRPLDMQDELTAIHKDFWNWITANIKHLEKASPAMTVNEAVDRITTNMQWDRSPQTMVYVFYKGKGIYFPELKDFKQSDLRQALIKAVGEKGAIKFLSKKNRSNTFLLSDRILETVPGDSTVLEPSTELAPVLSGTPGQVKSEIVQLLAQALLIIKQFDTATYHKVRAGNNPDSLVDMIRAFSTDLTQARSKPDWIEIKKTLARDKGQRDARILELSQGRLRSGSSFRLDQRGSLKDQLSKIFDDISTKVDSMASAAMTSAGYLLEQINTLMDSIKVREFTAPSDSDLARILEHIKQLLPGKTFLLPDSLKSHFMATPSVIAQALYKKITRTNMDPETNRLVSTFFSAEPTGVTKFVLINDKQEKVSEYRIKLLNGEKRVLEKAAQAGANAAMGHLDNPLRGGIDLSAQDSALRVEKDANGGVKVNVDPAMFARVEREGLREVDPVIINMQPADMRSMFGLDIINK